jgi:hypothetical protein
VIQNLQALSVPPRKMSEKQYLIPKQDWKWSNPYVGDFFLLKSVTTQQQQNNWCLTVLCYMFRLLESHHQANTQLTCSYAIELHTI